jgi:hypothetical protein
MVSLHEVTVVGLLPLNAKLYLRGENTVGLLIPILFYTSFDGMDRNPVIEQFHYFLYFIIITLLTLYPMQIR